MSPGLGLKNFLSSQLEKNNKITTKKLCKQKFFFKKISHLK